jgi:hypothetical protein
MRPHPEISRLSTFSNRKGEDGDYAGYEEEALRRDIAHFGRRYGPEIARQICAEELNRLFEARKQ